jgi:hypothetical protein
MKIARTITITGFVATTLTLSACSLNSRLGDQQQPPISDPRLSSGGTSGVVTCVPPNCPPPPTCDFDTRQVVETQGRYIEIVTSSGRLFEFENGLPVQAAGLLPQLTYTPTAAGVAAQAVPGAYDLTQVPLYAQGPCAGMAPGSCNFDTQAWVLLPEGRFLEYVTVQNRQYVFENNMMTGAGIDLDAIPRYDPICDAEPTGVAPCQFDTRTFIKQGGNVIESITAYGRLWELDINGLPLPNSGIDLSTIPKYATGPCMGAPLGQCVLNTRTFEPSPAGLIETVTANGMAYRYPANAAAAAQPAPVVATPHWLNGPCRLPQQ